MAVVKQKRISRKVGDVLRIDLENGRHSYAQVAGEPLIIFFEGVFDEQIATESIPHLPVTFRLWVSNHAVTGGIWPIIAHHPLTPENAAEPFFYKQDSVSGELSLYHSKFADTNYEQPTTLAKCNGLECAAIWEPEHVADRLHDHAAGRSNMWADRIKIDVLAIGSHHPTKH